MDELKQKWQKEILSRLAIIKIVILLLVMAIFARLIYIQFFDENIGRVSHTVHKRLISSQTLYATRGEILARNGSPLASSILRRSIFFDFASHGFDNDEKFAKNADSLSKLLSSYFGDHSARWYYNRMDSVHRKATIKKLSGVDIKERRQSPFSRLIHGKLYDTVPLYDITRRHTYYRLFRDVDGNEWAELSQYPILNENMGVVYRDEYKDTRIYPHGNLAMRTIGRTDVQNPYGIEHAYRDTLAGKNGKVYLQYMAPNFKAKIENDTLKTIQPVNGADIVTTIDIELQDVADRALRQALKEQNGEWGTTVVMECATGDILAMVNLSRSGNGEYFEGPNHAIGTPMEPGSTLKLATTMILLDKAGMSPKKEYNSGYGKRVKVGKYNSVEDSHPIGTRKKPQIDLKTAFTESANVYFVKAVINNFEGRESEYYQALCDLQLDHHIAFEEFQPKAPYLPKPKSAKWYGSTLGMLAYGYGLEITPIQTLTLYNAVANGGKMIAPRLITQMRRNGEIIADFPTKVIKDSVCTQQTLALVREYLENVAIEGTAEEYFSPDVVPFRVGTKTGTATIAMGNKYSDAHYLGSMVTYLPADNPRYTFITAIYKKKGKGSIYGAKLAGPVQQRVASYLYNKERDWAERLVVSDVKQLPTAVKGGNIEHIGSVASKFDLASAYTSPTGWGTTNTGISSITIKSISSDRREVPDVMGMGLADALFLLESRGLKVKFSGNGKVVSQSKKAGSAIRQGDKIELKLE